MYTYSTLKTEIILKSWFSKMLLDSGLGSESKYMSMPNAHPKTKSKYNQTQPAQHRRCFKHLMTEYRSQLNPPQQPLLFCSFTFHRFYYLWASTGQTHTIENPRETKREATSHNFYLVVACECRCMHPCAQMHAEARGGCWCHPLHYCLKTGFPTGQEAHTFS